MSKKAYKIIVFLGPDGAGKSTVMARVASDMARRGCPSKQFYFAPGFLPRYRAKRQADITSDPHEGRQYGAMLVAAKIALMLFEFNVGVRLVRRRNELAFFDRFIHDILVDPKRYRMSHMRWWMRIMLALAPRPDLLVVITAPAEMIHTRKSEVPFSETVRQIDLYKSLDGQFAETCLVENSNTPEEAANQIIDRIVRA